MNYQLAYKKYEKQETKMRQLRTLLLHSVSSAIQIELEDLKYIDALIAAGNYLKKVYSISNERVRENLIQKVNNLTLLTKGDPHPIIIP